MKVLLSIKPQFAHKIFSGEKIFEFRKAMFKNNNIDTVAVYSSSPHKKVIGEFTIESIICLPVEELWGRTEIGAGISKEYFDEYFKGRKYGFAIEVGKAIKYKVPLLLSDLKVKSAPQSFMYLKD